MNYTDVLSISAGAAICYSGYREGQYPGSKYPSYSEVKEDLLIVQDQWQYIRLYSCLLYTSPSPRDPKTSRMPSSA